MSKWIKSKDRGLVNLDLAWRIDRELKEVYVYFTPQDKALLFKGDDVEECEKFIDDLGKKIG